MPVLAVFAGAIKRGLCYVSSLRKSKVFVGCQDVPSVAPSGIAW
jgi:hypothetical protein